MNKTQIISGKQIASDITDNIKKYIDQLKITYDKTPTLAVILIGTMIQSETYVRLKGLACNKVGINFMLCRFDSNVEQNTVINKIMELNSDHNINGILVQLPLPLQLNQTIIMDTIKIEKDIDGLNSVNLGKLVSRRKPLHLPCTPKGIIRIFDTVGINLAGKNIVILGRSNIVGIPLFHLMLERDATITLCHSKTINLIDKLKLADIVVSAMGKGNFIQGEWLKDGCIAIDVGINNNNDEKKISLIGDFNFDSCSKHTSYITPVPGGVGPMTIAMVLENTLNAFIKMNE